MNRQQWLFLILWAACSFILVFLCYTEAFYFHWHYLLIVGLISHANSLIRKFFPCAYKVKYTLYLFFNQVFWCTWSIWSWVYAQCEIRIQFLFFFFCFIVFPKVSSQRTTEHIHVGLFLGSLFYPVCLSIFSFCSPTVIIGYCCFVVRLKLDWVTLSIIFSFISVIVIVIDIVLITALSHELKVNFDNVHKITFWENTLKRLFLS